jgi:ectoine hydroxylase-related dioxygenase (phytanoyl-CoA dioxygenase family)
MDPSTSTLSAESILELRNPSLPDVLVFDSTTANAEEVVRGLCDAGICIIKGSMSTADLETVENDVRPWITQDLPWKGDNGFPQETRRVCGLVEKSKPFTEKIVFNDLYQEVCNTMLSSSFTSWYGLEKMTSISKPQLNNTIIFSIWPGAKKQALHRDDIIHHNTLTEITASEYTFGRDVGIGYFIAGKRATRQNGATRFIPGSHLWGPETFPDENLCQYAELEPGDAFIILSSCYHGGSANCTIDEERLMYSCFMTKGILRQVGPSFFHYMNHPTRLIISKEENQYLANNPDKISSMYAPEKLKVIGYDISKPYLGWVNHDTPLKVLLGDETPDIESMY